MNGFHDNVLTLANVRDQGGNVIFDTSIQNDENCILVDERILVNVIKFNMICDAYVSVFSVNWMKKNSQEKCL